MSRAVGARVRLLGPRPAQAHPAIHGALSSSPLWVCPRQPFHQLHRRELGPWVLGSPHSHSLSVGLGLLCPCDNGCGLHTPPDQEKSSRVTTHSHSSFLRGFQF